ncbi:MAG: UDP-3-O-(3-hydroxymyristoyl)glucosamine N-acyltransferase [Spirochaetes bacterium]|nr:UDP-3-O-(3-hydroxymyristoyl)glucosamine N-acyltransferase [Spirochaetota bacterium]
MKLSEIAKILNGTMLGNDVEIENVGSLDEKFENAVLYVEKKKFLDRALSLNPAALVVSRGLKTGDVPRIEVDDPKFAFIKLLDLFTPEGEDSRGISRESYVADGAVIGKGAVVMPGTVIMNGVRIGEGSVIYPGCVLERNSSVGVKSVLYSGVIVRERCVIGDECIIHSGAVLGSDGFGYYEKDGRVIKIPQIGTVRVGNRVEIGANSSIDRGTVGATEIGDDTKLDNLVHIAHNVKIGKSCYIAALAGISGSVTVGNHVAIMGQVGVSDHISIADGTVILGQSAIPGDIEKADIYIGTPIRQVREHHRINAALKYLPELLKRVRTLEEKNKGEES